MFCCNKIPNPTACSPPSPPPPSPFPLSSPPPPLPLPPSLSPLHPCPPPLPPAMDSASASGAEGWGFESPPGRFCCSSQESRCRPPCASPLVQYPRCFNTLMWTRAAISHWRSMWTRAAISHSNISRASTTAHTTPLRGSTQSAHKAPAQCQVFKTISTMHCATLCSVMTHPVHILGPLLHGFGLRQLLHRLLAR